MKRRENDLAVAHTSILGERAITRLENAAKAVHESETNSRKDRELQLVSTAVGGFNAIIRHGKTIVEISGNDFAVRQMD
jgi:hypothetical protein